MVRIRTGVRGISYARTHARLGCAYWNAFAAPVRYAGVSADRSRRQKSRERSARDRRGSRRDIYIPSSCARARAHALALGPTVFHAKSAVNIVERARGHVVIATCGAPGNPREIGRPQLGYRRYAAELCGKRVIMARAKHSCTPARCRQSDTDTQRVFKLSCIYLADTARLTVESREIVSLLLRRLHPRVYRIQK